MRARRSNPFGLRKHALPSKKRKQWKARAHALAFLRGGVFSRIVAYMIRFQLFRKGRELLEIEKGVWEVSKEMDQMKNDWLQRGIGKESRGSIVQDIREALKICRGESFEP